MKPAITTSWDDGHPLDLRLGALLAKYGLKGTFYIPTNYSEWPLMTKSQIRELDSMGMEIGSHTKNHTIVPRLTKADAMRELIESREALEDLLGKTVPAFCFPKGKFSMRSCALVREAGYKLARTTVGFRTERNFDPACMPVTVQFVPHSRQIHWRHALKEGNAAGLLNWARYYKFESDLPRLCRLMMERASEARGVFHPWGHSWEIEQLGLWRQLEDVLRAAAALGLEPRTNSEVV